MMAPRTIVAGCVVVIAITLFARWQQRPVDWPPGTIAPEAPSQAATERAPFTFADFTLTPRADFSLRARVLGREPYRFDAGARLAPLDLALGWGPMSDQALLDQLDVSQSGRWFVLRWDRPPALPEDTIMRHSANMHIVPADRALERELERVRVGQVVRLRGVLIDAVRADGWSWRTSLTRDDTGGGSCELFFVEDVVVEPPLS